MRISTALEAGGLCTQEQESEQSLLDVGLWANWPIEFAVWTTLAVIAPVLLVLAAVAIAKKSATAAAE